MNKRPKTILGIMSGSSLDGIDLAKVRFYDTNQFEWIETAEIPIPKEWVELLKQAEKLGLSDFFKLEADYTRFQASQIPPSMLMDTDAISWHGHTLFHEPEDGFSIQMGNAQLLASLTGLPCFGAFRQADIARGGQGAPLAPIVDYYFFKEFDICINLGGIANVSFPQEPGPGFDICGFNQILNQLANELGETMDKDGNLSSKGLVDQELLSMLNHWPFLKEAPPKSLSNQEVRNFYFEVMNRYDLSVETKMRTFIEHTVEVIAGLTDHNRDPKVLLTGGGSMNQTFVSVLKQHLPKGIVEVVPEPWRTFKEAFLMSFMAWLKMEKLPNILSSTTGVPFDQISGAVYYP